MTMTSRSEGADRGRIADFEDAAPEPEVAIADRPVADCSVADRPVADSPVERLAESQVPSSLERLTAFLPDPAEAVESSDSTQATRAASATPLAVRAAELLKVSSGCVTVRFSDGSSAEADIASNVEAAFLRDALQDGQAVLVEVGAGTKPLVVGVMQVRRTRVLRADTLAIEAGRDLTLRSGRAAVRLRSDGEIELLGTRISAVSRGVMRLVGRALKLN